MELTYRSDLSWTSCIGDLVLVEKYKLLTADFIADRSSIRFHVRLSERTELGLYVSAVM